MQRSLIAPILGLAIVLASVSAAPAVAGEVYQWKDSKGVTHYSQTPPSQGTSYQQREITSAGQAQTSQQLAAVATAETPQCTQARKNIEALQSKGAVQEDSDGDGKLDRTLSDADRVNQMELAQATVKATCVGTATAAKP
jgi:hypothetical protein